MASGGNLPCDVFVGKSSDGNLSLISRVLWRNIGVLVLAVALVLFGGVLVFQWVRSIRQSIAVHQQLVKPMESPIKISAVKDAGSELLGDDISNLLSGYANKDDYMPIPVKEKQLLDDLPSERDAVKRRINELKTVYSDYNKEVTAYSRDVLKKEPGNDIVDERILTKAADL
jgi:hypothetical protein